MPDRLSIHEPVLVNTIGHCAGAVIFGILLYLFVVNWRRAREERSSLPALAAALAMLWNIGSLIALATGPSGGLIADIIVAGSFSVLSLLPAVLLHISLEANHRAVWLSGYLLSLIAVALHIGDLLTQAPRFHHAALLLVTLGFSGLTAISVFLEMRHESRRAAVSRGTCTATAGWRFARRTRWPTTSWRASTTTSTPTRRRSGTDRCRRRCRTRFDRTRSARHGRRGGT